MARPPNEFSSSLKTAQTRMRMIKMLCVF